MTSSRRSGVKARRESGYSVRQPRNGRKRWLQPIKRERISQSRSGRVHRSDLVVMARDADARRGGYSSRSYAEVLDDQMPRCWEPGLIFMQDNASIHTAHIIRDWF